MRYSGLSKIRSTTKNFELLQTRREKLIKSAIGLFVSKGFDKVTVDQIADLADMSKGTIYNYIGKKEDLIILILDYINSDFNSKVKNNIKKKKGMNWSDVLRVYIKAYLKMVDRRRDAINFLNDIIARLEPTQRKLIFSARLETYRDFEAILAKGKQAGEFNVEDTKLMAHNIVRILTSWANNYWYLCKFINFDQYMEKEIEFILQGLGIISSQIKI